MGGLAQSLDELVTNCHADGERAQDLLGGNGLEVGAAARRLRTVGAATGNGDAAGEAPKVGLRAPDHHDPSWRKRESMRGDDER